MRRNFRHLFYFAGLILIGFAKPAPAQQIVKFKASEPVEKGEVQLRGELYRPSAEGKYPALVIMHGCSGWVPSVRYSLRNYGTDLQSKGFAVLNLDSFGPRYYSADEMCGSNDRLQHALRYRTSDAYDALRWLASQEFVDRNNVFLMGQSNGGSVAMRSVLSSTIRKYVPSNDAPRFRGAVAFYPWCGIYGNSADIGAPLRIFSGGRDNWTPADECTALRARGAPFDVIVYPNAAHSFDTELIASKYMGFLVGKDPEAAADSRRRMVNFMNRNLDRSVTASAGSAQIRQQ